MKIAKHKNGLSVAYDGPFFAFASSTVRNMYTSYVSANGYAFNQICHENIDILTPAQQLLFVPSDATRLKYKLSKIATKWLNDTIGEHGTDWDVDLDPFDLMFASIFFSRRTDAVAFVRWVNEIIGTEKGVYLE